VSALCIGHPSSTASTPVAGAQRAINSDDPAWSHCYCPDITKKQNLKCKYYDKLCSGGITRIKYYLTGIKGFNTTKCLKVPPQVQQEMFALITKKTSEKAEKAKEKERERAEVDIDHSDCGSGSEDSEHGNVVLVVKPKETKGSSSSRSIVHSGSIQKYYKPPTIEESAKTKLSNKVQTTLTTQKREERRDRTCEYICQWFYEASIPHNIVSLPSFANMLEAIGQFGRGLRGPSPYEMSGPFL